MDNVSVNKSKKATDLLLFIPLIVFFLGIILFIAAVILEKPTSRGTIYSICFILSMICFVMDIMPGIILAVIGTVRASKEKRIGFVILGIAETVGALGGILLICFIIFVAGPGV